MAKNDFSGALKESFAGRAPILNKVTSFDENTPAVPMAKSGEEKTVTIVFEKKTKYERKNYSYYLETRVHDKLKEIADNSGKPSSELLNEILKQVFDMT